MPDLMMPKLSDTMTEGTLVSWKKKKGDKISAGDVLADIETDKATMEWEATDDGILTEIFVEEGGKVNVGDKIAFIGGEGETSAPPADGAAEKTPEAEGQEKAPAPAGAAAAAEKTATPNSEPKPADGKPAPSEPPNGEQRVKISPLARKIAAEKGVDIFHVQGSGPGARIVQKDVLAAAAQKPAAAQPAISGESKRTPLSSMRKTIAERLVLSKTTIPHFYLNIDVDAGPLQKLRAEANAAAEADGVKFTINDFILRAAVAAATRVPRVNATFDGDAIVDFPSVHLAVAVAVEDGLVTPVLRDAQTKTLREINAAVKDFAVRARAKKLKPEEYQGGTLTVSNLGSYGIDSFSAIINPPQAVILSVGAIVKRPVVSEHNQIVIGHRLNIGMSCDHRVVDGAVGAQYLAELRKLIESPALMLI